MKLKNQLGDPLKNYIGYCVVHFLLYMQVVNFFLNYCRFKD